MPLTAAQHANRQRKPKQQCHCFFAHKSSPNPNFTRGRPALRAPSEAPRCQAFLCAEFYSFKTSLALLVLLHHEKTLYARAVGERPAKRLGESVAKKKNGGRAFLRALRSVAFDETVSRTLY
jgi:hypothetical protein